MARKESGEIVPHCDSRTFPSWFENNTMRPIVQSSFRRRLSQVLLLLLAWAVAVMGRIVYVGGQDHAEKADVVIVLGAAVRKGEASPAFAGRIRHGIELWKKGLAPKIIFTGGLGHDGLIPESEVARGIAVRDGIPTGDIFTETVSTSTWENFTEAARIMRENGLHRAIVVSDPYHLHRASIMAEDSGFSAVTSPTPYTAFQTWRTKLPFLLNELRLCHSHWIYRAAGMR